MAGEAVQALVSAGPFLGINNTLTDIYTSPTKGMSMTAGDCEIIPQSLVAKAGRTQLFQAAITASVFGYIAQADDTRPLLLVGPTIPAWIAGASNQSVSYEWDPILGFQTLTFGTNTTAGGLPFTQAIGFASPGIGAGAPVFATNFNTRVQAVNGGGTEFTFTQHSKPPAVGNVSYSQASGGGSVGLGNYTYAFTYFDNNTGQETSATFDPVVTAVTGTNNEIVLQNTGSGFNFTGFFPNDAAADEYFVNFYRSSVAQPTFFFVGQASAFNQFIDTSSDATISANRQLTFNRDVAPVKVWGDFSPLGNVIPNNLETLYYPGAPMWEHQGRLFFFVYVQNSDTAFQPQYQLQYSNLFRYWEFDKVNNVFLVDDSMIYTPFGNDITVPPTLGIVPYIYPNNLFMEMPSAGISLASIALFWTTKRMFILYGNSPSTYTFQKFADIGCLSTQSLAYATTENSIAAFWMSEDGIYMTTGQSIQYISEDIRLVIDGLSVSDRYSCVGFYSNHTYYISFPQANQTWAYRTTTQQWHGPIPYSVLSAASVPSDPVLTSSSAGPGPLNSVAAVRSGHVPGTGFAAVDAMFTQVDTDLGLPQTVTYQSNDQGTIAAPSLVQAGLPVHIEKEYTIVALVNKVQNVPKGTLFANVEITVDDDPTKVGTVQFDLSQGPCQIGTVSYEGLGQGPLRGYVANLKITYTTVAGNPTAPIQIKNVTVYGKAGQRNLTPTVGMS